MSELGKGGGGGGWFVIAKVGSTLCFPAAWSGREKHVCEVEGGTGKWADFRHDKAVMFCVA